jgi:hypothetical protein
MGIIEQNRPISRPLPLQKSQNHCFAISRTKTVELLTYLMIYDKTSYTHQTTEKVEQDPADWLF